MTKKTFFLSDFHLGVDARISSHEREKILCKFFDSIAHEAERVFLVGDVFDFWFDYKHAIPKGYIRLLGKLAELRDFGIEMHFFRGNHDLWMFHYFQDELGIPIYSKPKEFNLNGKSFLIGHGDGLGPGDHGYKFIKKIFTSPISQFLFRWIHPDIGIGLANYFSGKSRNAQDLIQTFQGVDQEWLIQYCEQKIQENPYDYLVFGHRHLPIDYVLKNQHSRYVNLGDWLSFQSYAVFNGESLSLQFFENEFGKVYP